MSEIPYDRKREEKHSIICTLEYEDNIEYRDESYKVEVKPVKNF